MAEPPVLTDEIRLANVEADVTNATPERSPDEVLAALAAFPNEIARMIADQSDEALMQPARDGGWGVVEILPHLRDWEEIFLQRAQAILKHEQPELPAHDDELWAIERDYRGQDPRATLDHFRELRGQVVELLGEAPPEAWERTGQHAVHDEITLLWLANSMSNHDREHLEQIRDALA
ncbi:MAG TPA: DinB family protein [Thermomicrobiales bacterium]|nr:DinB family protein [Thermomicrobiales bacterium]